MYDYILWEVKDVLQTVGVTSQSDGYEIPLNGK